MIRPRGKILFLAVLVLSAGCAETNPVSPQSRAAIFPPGELIDDFESGLQQNKFGGYWFVFADANGSRVEPGADGPVTFYAQGVSPTPNSSLTPNTTFRFSGLFGTATPAAPVFAGFGGTLSTGGVPMDLSGYTGVQFYCRGGIQSEVAFVLKKKSVSQTNADFQYVFTPPADWTLIQVPFAALAQPADAQPVPFTAMDVISVQWMPSKEQQAFDFQIDDVKLY